MKRRHPFIAWLIVFGFTLGALSTLTWAQAQPPTKVDPAQPQVKDQTQKDDASEQQSDSATAEDQPELAAQAATLLQARMDAEEDERIPASLREDAKCMIVFPSVIKAGFVLALKSGQGLGSCRLEKGQWGAPAYFNISAASVGLQAGVQSASIILLVRDQLGVDQLMKGKVSFGGGLSLAAGPVGTAANISTQAAVLSYVRTKGLFAGIDLEGASLSLSEDRNQELYGEMSPQEMMFIERAIPDSVKAFHNQLSQYAPAP